MSEMCIIYAQSEMYILFQDERRFQYLQKKLKRAFWFSTTEANGMVAVNMNGI